MFGGNKVDYQMIILEAGSWAHGGFIIPFFINLMSLKLLTIKNLKAILKLFFKRRHGHR
jgi:hypothetical protein